jgi:hypothetical protein
MPVTRSPISDEFADPPDHPIANKVAVHPIGDHPMNQFAAKQ